MVFLHRAFVPVLIALLSGVAIASYVLPSYAFAASFALVAASAVALALLRFRSARLMLLAACALGIALGAARFTFHVTSVEDGARVIPVGERMILRGVVDEEPDVRERTTQITVLLKERVEGGVIVPARGRMLLTLNRYPEYAYGDRIEIEGVLKRPEQFMEDNGRVFDYPAYLRAKGIAFQMFYPRIVVLAHNEGSSLRSALFSLKHAFLDRLALALPEPHNALAGGILLGGKRSLGDEWTEYFRAAGLVHVVVLSGYNMTLVAEWLGGAFLFLGFYGSLAVSASGIALFALAAGAGATVLRAAIMALLVLLARLTGKTETMGRSLLLAGALMVLHNPAILAFDPSFQLSFLASLGLVFIAPALKDRWHGRLGKYPVFEEVIVTTFATQIAVLPLLLYQTGAVSLIAPITNVLVLPIIPITMFLSFITGLLGFLGQWIALGAGIPAMALLSWILAVAKYATLVPFAVIHTPPVAGYMVIVLYALIAWVVFRHRLSADRRDPLGVRT